MVTGNIISPIELLNKMMDAYSKRGHPIKTTLPNDMTDSLMFCLSATGLIYQSELSGISSSWLPTGRVWVGAIAGTAELPTAMHFTVSVA